MSSVGPRKVKQVRPYSIRTYLLLLVLAVSIPLVIIVGLGIYAEMQQSIAHTKTTLRVVVHTMVSNTERKIADARRILEQVAVRPLVRRVDPKNCDAILQDLLTLYPGYANIGYSNVDGLIVCSAVPQPGGKLNNIGKSEWFQRFLEQKRFTVGEPFLGPITNRFVSVLSVPIWNERQEMVGAVHLPLDLKTYDPDVPAHLLPTESRLGFLNEAQTMIWRNFDPEDLIGTRVNSEASQQIVAVRDGELEAPATDGVTRFYSVMPMPAIGWIAYVGVPASSVYAAARQHAMINTATAVLAIFLMILFAISFARKITTPVAELESVARKVHAGDKRIRAAVAGPAEIVAVAEEFNTMIDAQQLSEARFRSVMESDLIGLLFWNASGQITDANDAFLRIVGYSREELRAGRLDWKNMTPPEYRESDDQAVKSVAANGSCEAYEKEYFDKRGARVPILIGGAGFPHLPGEGVAFVLDISKRRQAEKSRASLEAQLRESQKMQAIGTLAGGIAHDFNNIIASILGNTELARQDAGNIPNAVQSLEEIRKSATRARDLVQQILSFSRRQPTERQLIALVPVIDESVRLLRATLPSRAALAFQAEPGLPVVRADATHIQQVVINLVNNAVQAMQGAPGDIGIRLDTVQLDAAMAQTDPALGALHAKLASHDGRLLRLTVSDSGAGMDAATQARIFEPFFTTKPVDEGTGLGLAVVHGIVHAHEGAITVESWPGKGATFTLYLPAAEADATGLEDKEVVPARVRSAGRGQHILYLDDDESLVFLVKRLLERRGYRLSGYTSQQEALEALRSDPLAYILVVTDYNMPGMSGLDVAREVRKIRADLPVALASGFIDDILQAKAADVGVRELIFKANAVESLCDAFARLIELIGVAARRKNDV